MPWSTAGSSTRRSYAGSGRRPASTRPAAPSAFATSCRMRWPLRSPIPTGCASRSWSTRRASSPRATCSTGGTCPAAPACARISPTTCCGCPMPSRTTSRSRPTGRCSTRSCLSSTARGIPDGAEDAYYAPQTSSQTATMYEHCARTIDRSLATGIHGLPLMGTGDWNDGMNRVGHEGRGESVWLAWFLCSVVERYRPRCASARRHGTRATLAGGAQGLDRCPARRRLGRRLVPARLLRQRRTAGLRRSTTNAAST